MNYEATKRLVAEGYSTHELARAFRTSQTNVRFWLRKFDLQTNRSKFAGRVRCKCGETDPSKYYGNKKTICAKCDNAYTAQRQREMTKRVRAHMGGKCKLCDFGLYQVALSLHHIDPAQKDPNFHCFRGWSWRRVLREIAKCVLVCNNCHAAIHAGVIAPTFT